MENSASSGVEVLEKIVSRSVDPSKAELIARIREKIPEADPEKLTKLSKRMLETIVKKLNAGQIDEVRKLLGLPEVEPSTKHQDPEHGPQPQTESENSATDHESKSTSAIETQESEASSDEDSAGQDIQIIEEETAMHVEEQEVQIVEESREEVSEGQEGRPCVKISGVDLEFMIDALHVLQDFFDKMESELCQECKMRLAKAWNRAFKEIEENWELRPMTPYELVDKILEILQVRERQLVKE